MAVSAVLGSWIPSRQRRSRGAGTGNAAGCPDAPSQTLRHTTATLLLSDGHDLAAVSELLGHSSKVITLSIYSHVTASSRQDIADALGAHLWA